MLLPTFCRVFQAYWSSLSCTESVSFVYWKFSKICLERVNLLLEVTLESVLNTHALISFIRVNPYENIYFTNKLYEPPKYASANIFHFLADPGWKFYFPSYRVRKKYLRLKYACAIIVLVIFLITVYSFLL